MFFRPFFLTAFLICFSISGWYANPKAWRRNTILVGVGAIAALAYIFSVSAENEVRFFAFIICFLCVILTLPSPLNAKLLSDAPLCSISAHQIIFSALHELFSFFLQTFVMQRRVKTPGRPIPSQRWSKWTLVDDPEYVNKREEYHRTKLPFWRRIFPTDEDDEE